MESIEMNELSLRLQDEQSTPSRQSLQERNTAMEEMIDGSDELRIVLLGKTGAGKSSAGNTILGQKFFDEKCSSRSQTQDCNRQEGTVAGRQVTVIDTPGIFDTNRSEKDLKYELVSCLTECAPGPHAFVLVFEVGRYTEEARQTVRTIREWFGEDALKHTVVLFTHGDELEDDMTIRTFLDDEGGDENCGGTSGKGRKKKDDTNTLKSVVRDCGNRAHVIDNKHWKTKDKPPPNEFDNILEMMGMMPGTSAEQLERFTNLLKLSSGASAGQALGGASNGRVEREYRSNSFQVSELMTTIETMGKENGGHYTNGTLEIIAKEIEEEVKNITRELEEEGQEEEMSKIKRRARERVRNRTLRLLSGISTGALLGALLGVAVGATLPVVLVAGLLSSLGTKVCMDVASNLAKGKPIVLAVLLSANVASKDIITGVRAGKDIARNIRTAFATVGRVGAVGTTGTTAGTLGAETGALGVTGAVGIGAEAITGIAIGVTAGVLAVTGAVGGGIKGAQAAKKSDDSNEAAKKALKSVVDQSEKAITGVWEATQKLFQPQGAQYHQAANEKN